MKRSLQLLILLMIASFSPLRAEDYIITINGISQEIGLDQETTLILPDGASLRLTLHQKEYLRFVGDLISFEHKSKYKPNRTDLGNGVFQTMIATLLTPRMSDPANPELVYPANPRPSYPAQEKNQKISRPD